MPTTAIMATDAVGQEREQQNFLDGRTRTDLADTWVSMRTRTERICFFEAAVDTRASLWSGCDGRYPTSGETTLRRQAPVARPLETRCKTLLRHRVLVEKASRDW